MTEKYFPDVGKACPWKWGFSTIHIAGGTTKSCHRCQKHDIDPDNFDNFHNTDLKVKEREIMLDNKWPTVENGGTGHCNYCKVVEDAGGISDRTYHMTIPGLTPKEITNDSMPTKVTPSILEVFINNTCNLKCVYCGPQSSSLWYKELKKYGPTVEGVDGDFEYSDNQSVILEKTLDWLARNSHELSRFQLLGGETFYQTETDRVYDALEKNKSRLEFSITSNFMIPKDRFEHHLDRIKHLIVKGHIGRFDLTASIDSWGPSAEYTRTGLKLDHFQKLFEYSLNKRWINHFTNSTIGATTLREFPELLELQNEYRKHYSIQNTFGFITGWEKDFLRPHTYGLDFWRDDIDRVMNAMPESTPGEISSKSRMSGLLFSMPKNKDLEKIQDLHFYFDELDRRRNTNWRNVFSYLI